MAPCAVSSTHIAAWDITQKEQKKLTKQSCNYSVCISALTIAVQNKSNRDEDSKEPLDHRSKCNFHSGFIIKMAQYNAL